MLSAEILPKMHEMQLTAVQSEASFFRVSKGSWEVEKQRESYI